MVTLGAMVLTHNISNSLQLPVDGLLNLDDLLPNCSATQETTEEQGSGSSSSTISNSENSSNRNKNSSTSSNNSDNSDTNSNTFGSANDQSSDKNYCRSESENNCNHHYEDIKNTFNFDNNCASACDSNHSSSNNESFNKSYGCSSDRKSASNTSDIIDGSGIICKNYDTRETTDGNFGVRKPACNSFEISNNNVTGSTKTLDNSISRRKEICNNYGNNRSSSSRKIISSSCNDISSRKTTHNGYDKCSNSRKITFCSYDNSNSSRKVTSNNYDKNSSSSSSRKTTGNSSSDNSSSSNEDCDSTTQCCVADNNSDHSSDNDNSNAIYNNNININNSDNAEGNEQRPCNKFIKTNLKTKNEGDSSSNNKISVEGCDWRFDSIPLPKVRMLVVGAHRVGKSAIVVRFLTQRFIGEYHSEVDIVYRETLRQGIHSQLLEIIDISTRDADDYSIPLTEVRNADCIVVVFNIAEEGTLSVAHLLLSSIDNATQLSRPPITLLGNKLDLEEHRQVPREKGEAVAEKFNCAFAEVSAAESSADITPVFLHLVHLVNTNNIKTNNIICNSSWNNKTCKDPYFECPYDCPSKSPCALRKRNGWQSDLELLSNIPSATNKMSCGFNRQNSFKQCSEKLRSRFDRSAKRNFTNSEGKSLFSQRCHSYDEALNLSKMEVFDTRSDSSKTLKQDAKMKNRYAVPRKKSKPQIPTGKSKNRKINNKPVIKSLDTRLTKNDDLLFLPADRSLSNLHLSCAETSVSQEKSATPKNLRHQNGFNVSALSKSVDQNLQKCCYQNEKQNKCVKLGKGSQDTKPLSILQRGRSFIQEAKDKHWKDKDIRHSIRSFASKNDVHRPERPTSLSRSPLLIPSGSSQSIRSKNLPTGGKTWVSRSEGDDDRTPLFDDLKHSRTSSISERLAASSPPSSRVSPTRFTVAERVPTTLFLEATGDRRRKLSVFSKTLGNFLSRGSMPDLPRATASLYGRFDLFKKSIKKRSV